MSEESTALVPVEEKIVSFYEDEVVAVAVEADGERQIVAPMRPIVEYLGLAWSSQLQRIRRDPVLARKVVGVFITNTPTAGGTSGGRQEMLCLPLDMIHGWLFGITVSRVKEELQEKILRYQEECYRVLYAAFTPSQAASPTSDDSDALWLAMRENAQQQVELWDAMIAERRRLRETQELVDMHEESLWEHSRELDEHRAAIHELQREQRQIGVRLDGLTKILPAPRAAIGPEQKAALQELVKELVASAKDRDIRLGQGRNDYAAVWTAFNRRFRIAKYAELQSAQFEEAVRWLEEWLNRVRNEG